MTVPVQFTIGSLRSAIGYRIIRGQLIMLIDERTLLVWGSHCTTNEITRPHIER